ncbi:MAG: DUF1028 domain-containing protein [Reyranella sp.]|uniref:DUF1028 domain-containing protein n=1 Tax=Reyranella sp. TaxID=1929291 RepID=UPI00120F4257|nr:DUF1028 domain-containing protein [Reyranella sp.]TAJ42302.1 MAG: DUF1028 domain-containing protein [Reyranella sp.]
MTFSLVGRCARTGMLGAVVTTSAISVGARCQHARAGVGAALTQHRTDPRLGPLALDLLAKGVTADEAMQAVVAATPHRHWRQLALIDAAGRTAVYSGANVRGEKGEVQGKDCAAIANIVRSASLPGAMVAAFEKSPDLPLAHRLLEALEAGEAAGGERQPVISAALLVVHRESFPYVDLRVDDHTAPIAELGRLWSMYEPEADAYVVRAVDPEQAVPPPGMKIA